MNRTTQPARKATMAAAALLASSLVLAACGGSAESDDEPTPTGDAPGDNQATDEPSDEPISVKIARGMVNIESILIAEGQGYLEEEGLDAEVVLTSGVGGAATNSALIAGEFDIAATDAVTAVRAINEGMPIVVVAGTKSARPDYESDVSDGLIVPPGSPITEWTDLEGRSVGVPELGGLPHLTVMTAIDELGIDPDAVDIVPIPMDALVAAAENGQVDAVFTFSVFMLNALNEGFTRVGTGVREFLPYAPQSLWVSTTQFAEENPEALRRFHRALGRGIEYGNENPDAVRQVYLDNTEMPPAFIENAMILEPLDVNFQREGWDKLLTAMEAAGEIEGLTYEDVVWEGAR